MNTRIVTFAIIAVSFCLAPLLALTLALAISAVKRQRRSLSDRYELDSDRKALNEEYRRPQERS